MLNEDQQQRPDWFDTYPVEFIKNEPEWKLLQYKAESASGSNKCDIIQNLI